MKYGYIVNNGNDELDIYYHSGNSVMKRRLSKGVRGRAECIINDAREHFSLSVMRGEPVIVYRPQGGDVMLSAGGRQRVLQRGNGGREEIFLSALTGNNRMRLVYVNSGSLVTQSTDSNGGADAVRLDEVSGSMPYRLIPVVRGGYVLLYNRRTPERQFGYRELTASAVGDFKGVYTTGFDIGDCSACASDNILHLVFVSVSRFTVRVVYTKRTENGFSRPKNLWEGKRCGNVCIAADGCEVFVWWESGGSIFESSSDNSGESFSQCVRRGRASSLNKALHLSEGSYSVGEVMLSEGGDIFAPEPVKELIARHGNEVQSGDNEKPIRNTAPDLINELKSELAKKQEEIDRLAHTLRSNNRESGKREFELRSRNRALKEELERIKSDSIKEREDL